MPPAASGTIVKRTVDHRVSRRALDFGVSTAALGFVVVFPAFAPNEYWIGVVTVAMYYALMAMGWNLLAGYTGQYSFAPAAFALIGAYTSALTVIHLEVSPIVGIALGTVSAAILGLILGRVSFRLRGPYFALTTIAFAELVRYLVTNSYEITRGDLGLRTPPLFSGGANIQYYYVFLALCIAMQCLLGRLIYSRVGLYLQAIREDEVSALARGVDVVYWKTIASVLSAAICGMSGAVYVHFLRLASPQMGTLTESGLVVMAAVIGGIGTISGPLIGGLIIKPLAEFARGLEVQHILILGLVGMVVMRFFRDGMFGIVATAERKLSLALERRKSPASKIGEQ